MSHVEAVTAAHDRSWNEIMESIVKHGSEKRSLEPITYEKDKTLPTLWREEGLGPVVSFRTRRGGGGKREAGNAIRKRWSRRRRKRRRWRRRRSVFTMSDCRKRSKRSGGGRERRRRTKCQMQVRRKMFAAGDQMGR